jgi:hypothetical protein
MNLSGFPEPIEFFDSPGVGEVEEMITPQQLGRVRFMSTIWYAQFYSPLPLGKALPGTKVRVLGREGLILLVVPIDDWIYPPLPTSQPDNLDPPEEEQWLQDLNSWFTTWLG